MVAFTTVSLAATVALQYLNNRTAEHKLEDAVRYFADRSGEIEQRWLIEADVFRSQLELARALDTEDARALRARFISFAASFGGSAAFTHAVLIDGKNAIAVRYRTRSQQDLDLPAADATPTWVYGESDQTLYRAFGIPLLVNGARGRLVLYAPIDNALLGRSVFPDASVSLAWQGRTVARSTNATDPAIVKFGTVIEVARTIEWGTGRPAPQLEVRAQVPLPLTTVNLLVIVLATVGLAAALSWLVLGRWVTEQLRRLGALNSAAGAFTDTQSVSGEIPRHLSAAEAGRDDEIGDLSKNLGRMMRNIETAHQDLRLQQALNRQIIETSPIGICIYDESGDCIAANPAISAQIGGAREQVLAQNYHRIASWKQYGVYDLALRALEAGQPQYEVSKVVTSFGLQKWLGITFCTLPGNAHPRLMLMTVDLTAVKESEIALIESERKYRTLVEQAPDAVYLVDEQGRVVDINVAGAQILGLEPSEIVGHPFSTFMFEEELAAQPIRYAEMRMGQVAMSERRFKHVDGSVRIVELRGRILPNGMLQGVGRDVTERKRLEHELVELNMALEKRVAERTAELAAANADLEAFVSAVSHDLRTPLRGIDGFSELLIERHAGDLGRDATGYLERIRRGARRMGELIDDLLNLSRVSRTPFAGRAIDLSALASEVSTELPGQGGRSIHWKIEPGVIGHGDPGLLRIVLENLLGNALKYSRDARPAEIEFGSTGPRDDGVEFFLRDNGAGFDMAYSSKLFQPFQRLHGPKEFEGTGVGLATVWRIVQRHEGRIRAEASPGNGATFFVFIPASRGTS